MKVYVLGVILYIFSFLGIIFIKKHFLIILLYLEMSFLGGYIIIKNSFFFAFISDISLIYYLVIGVTEGVVGLSLLVYYLRIMGKEIIFFEEVIE